MNYDAIFSALGERSVAAGLIGAGQFGASFVGQASRTPRLDVPVVCDLDAERAAAVFVAAGYPEEDVIIADTLRAAKQGLESGKRVALGDATIVPELPIDIVVEATGNPEAGARIAMAAIDAGKRLAMVTKEADSVIGPYLSARAKSAGVVATPVDGDQPSLLIGLLSWARLLGLEVISAGKSSEYDFIYDRIHGTVSWRGEAIAVPDFADVWLMPERGVAETVEARREMLRLFPQRTVPDLCEMGVVCNHSGLLPDSPTFHAPHARTLEVPEVLRPKEQGGILARAGTIDVFNCLRRPDEQSFAGGVFIVVDCADRETWQVLKEKGIPVTRAGGHGMLYNPSHLLGVEAPLSTPCCFRQRLRRRRIRSHTIWPRVEPCRATCLRVRRSPAPWSKHRLILRCGDCAIRWTALSSLVCAAARLRPFQRSTAHCSGDGLSVRIGRLSAAKHLWVKLGLVRSRPHVKSFASSGPMAARSIRA